MARQKCTFKWQGLQAKVNILNENVYKSVRLNGKTKVFTAKVKWQDKSVRLNGKTKVYV